MIHRGGRSEARGGRPPRAVNLMSHFEAIFMLLAATLRRLRARRLASAFRRIGNCERRRPSEVNPERRAVLGWAVGLLRNTVKTKFLSLNVKLKMYLLVWRLMGRLPRPVQLVRQTVHERSEGGDTERRLALNLLGRISQRHVQKESQKTRYFFVISFYKLRLLARHASRNSPATPLTSVFRVLALRTQAVAFVAIKSHADLCRLRDAELTARTADLRVEESRFLHGNANARLRFLMARRARTRANGGPVT